MTQTVHELLNKPVLGMHSGGKNDCPINAYDGPHCEEAHSGRGSVPRLCTRETYLSHSVGLHVASRHVFRDILAGWPTSPRRLIIRNRGGNVGRCLRTTLLLQKRWAGQRLPYNGPPRRHKDRTTHVRTFQVAPEV